jgi:hypothetical protein
MSRHKKIAQKSRQRRHARGGGRHPRILVSFTTYTPESIEDGDSADSGWVDEDGVDMTPDEYDRSSGITAVDKAVKLLKYDGAGQPSSSHFHRGTWYSTEADTTDYRTGESEERAFHLKGFTSTQEREIFRRMTARR